jgi:hypothetical protein
MFTSSLVIHWCVPHESPNLPEISKMAGSLSSLSLLWTFSILLSVWPLEEQPVHSHLCTEFSVCLKRENKSEVYVFPISSTKAVFGSSYILNAVFLGLKQNIMQVYCFFVTQLWITLNMYKSQHPLWSSAEGWLQNSLDWLWR